MQRVLLNRGVMSPLVHVVVAQASRPAYKNLVSASCRFNEPVRRGVLAKAQDLSSKGGLGHRLPRTPTWLQQPTHRPAVRRYSGGGGGNGSGGGKGGGSGGGGGGAGDSGKPRGLAGLWAAYLSLLSTAPVATKTVTSAFLSAAGDIISQKYFEGNEKLDWKRTGIFAFLGFALVGPALHFWYLTLSRLIPAAGSGGAAGRLLLDQGAFAPFFIGVFFSALLMLEGHPNDIPAKLRQDWKDALIANWKLWVPFQFINFRFVPQQLQVLMANVVSVAWNTYLSWASHKKVRV